MLLLEPEFVHQSLERLKTCPRPVFCADNHRYQLNPVLSETEIKSFEEMHSIVLPFDYRHFLVTSGNGGVGPYYGVFPLGKMDDGFKLKLWNEGDGFIGTLSKPFPLKESWNDLSSLPDADLAETDPLQYERLFAAWERKHFDPHLLDGAFPVCHMGCALRVWLIVTGEQAGRLWRDGRTDDSGLSPVLTKDGRPATFSTWYLDWLEDPLLKP